MNSLWRLSSLLVLVQMGRDCAGWYSWGLLDHGGTARSQTIHPEWQDIAVGDRLVSTASANSWFQVAALEHQRFLGLRAPLDLRGHPFDTVGPRPRFYSDSLWGLLLEELPEDRTRLVVSGYACSAPKRLATIANVLFWEPAHWIMQTRQFAGLRRRAERNEGSQCPMLSAPTDSIAAMASE
jgi:hypothetical protein